MKTLKYVGYFPLTLTLSPRRGNSFSLWEKVGMRVFKNLNC
jgi:hypothetical protein